jgi:membrane-associated phospholipid phosphatase
MNYLDIFSLISTFVQLLYALGFFSELLILILVIYLLYDRTFELLFFLVGVTLNNILNRILKPILKDPRPSSPIKFLHSEKFPKKLEYTKNSNYYGMPSGHAQNVAYSLAYLYWTIQESNLLKLFSLLIGGLTVFERWWFRNHTLLQLAVGIMVGIILARITISLRNRVIIYKIM